MFKKSSDILKSYIDFLIISVQLYRSNVSFKSIKHANVEQTFALEAVNST